MDLLNNSFAQMFDAPILAASKDEKELFDLLVKIIDNLIVKNFERLAQVLYRVDVDEEKLKKLIMQNTDKPTAEIIAAMLLERQKQKLVLRRQFNASADDIAEEDRW